MVLRRLTDEHRLFLYGWDTDEHRWTQIFPFVFDLVRQASLAVLLS
jgi:hypothetical protein